MFSSPFLPLPAGLEIATTSMRDDLLVVQVISTNVRSCCPLCFCPAERRHSHYTRVVADLPCAGLRVQLILHVRRFLLRQHGLHQEDFYGAASRLRSAVGTSHGPSLRGSSISWTGDLWRGGNPAGSSSRYSNVANNDPSSSHDAAS